MKHLRSLTVLMLSLVLSLTGLSKIGVDYQMPLGNPSGAQELIDPPRGTQRFLIQRAQYAMDYSDAYGIPNWVSWSLTADDIGSSGRSEDFFVDNTLPSNFWRVGTGDYKYSGYDRGHLCPSADRTVSREDNDVLFYMSNMMPQRPDNNQGIWANFESYCRDLATEKDSGDNYKYELLITTGTLMTSGGPNPVSYPILASGVAVPYYVWKIVVVVPVGPGSALSRVNQDCRVIAIKVPNIQGIRNDPWQKYVTTVDQIEADTGYNFLNLVATSMADTLEAKNDNTLTGWTDTPSTPTATTPTITSQPASTSVVIGGTARFSVSATSNAGTATYQWYKDDLETPIAGATGSSYTISNVVSTDAGIYLVVVTNTVGSKTSDGATLTITTAAPASSSVTWNFGTGAEQASASSTIPSGLILSEVIRGNEAANNNSTNPAITTESANANYDGNSYSLQGITASKLYNIRGAGRGGAINTAPNGSLYFETTLSATTGNVATLSGIGFGSRSTGTGPTTITICKVEGTKVTELKVLSQAIDSKWYYQSTNLTSIPVVPGSPLTLRIYGSEGKGNTSSPCWRIDDLKLNVSVQSATPVISTQPEDTAGAVGGSATFSVAATGVGALSYQWYHNNTAITGNASALTARLQLTGLSASDIGSYHCVVSCYGASQTSGTASLTVTQSYEAWATASVLPSALAGEAQDADGDGVANLVEYALGLNPLLPDSQLLPACVLTDDKASFAFTRPLTTEGFAYNVQSSTDLANWHSVIATTQSETATSKTLLATADASAQRRFFRLVLGSVKTTPVGYVRESLAGSGALRAFSLVLDDTAGPAAGIRSGFVDTVTDTTITNAAAGWTGNLADPAAPWALRITSGAAAGRQFDVKSNTANSLTINGANLLTLGVLAGVDRFELIPLETLGTLFGSTTLQGGASSATADIVQLRSGSSWLAYYYDTNLGFWRRTLGTATNCNNVVIRPGSGLTIQRRGSALPLALTGRVAATPFRTNVARAGTTVVSLGFPTDTTLAGLAIQTLVPGWRTGSSDQLFLHNGSAWVSYYYNGSTWLRTSGLSAAGDTPVDGDAALLIQRSGTTAGTVELVRTPSF